MCGSLLPSSQAAQFLHRTLRSGDVHACLIPKSAALGLIVAAAEEVVK